MVLEPRSSNYPTCVPAFGSPCSHQAKPRTDFPAFEKPTPLSEAYPAYPGWGRLLPYLHQVHDHEPQEVPVMRQLPEVLAQGDVARLLSTQAMGQRGVKNSLGLGQIHPHPRAATHQTGDQTRDSAGHSPALRSQVWTPRLPTGRLYPPPQEPRGPHKA